MEDVQISVRFPADVYRKLEKLAELDDRKVSSLVRYLAVTGMDGFRDYLVRAKRAERKG